MPMIATHRALHNGDCSGSKVLITAPSNAAADNLCRQAIALFPFSRWHYPVVRLAEDEDQVASDVLPVALQAVQDMYHQNIDKRQRDLFFQDRKLARRHAKGKMGDAEYVAAHQAMAAEHWRLQQRLLQPVDAAVISQAEIIVATVSGSASRKLKSAPFGFVVVDEAGRSRWRPPAVGAHRVERWPRTGN